MTVEPALGITHCGTANAVTRSARAEVTNTNRHSDPGYRRLACITKQNSVTLFLNKELIK